MILLDSCLVELCDINSHDAVDGLGAKSSGNGIEGVSPSSKRFTIMISLIEPEINECGINMVFKVMREGRERERERGKVEERTGEKRKEEEGKKRERNDKGQREKKKYLAPG